MAIRLAGLFRRWLDFLDGVFFHERCRVCSSLLPPALLASEHHSVPLSQIPKAVCFDCWRCNLASNAVIELCPIKNSDPLHIASGRLYTGAVKQLIYKLKYDNDLLLAYDLALLIEKAWPLLEADVGDEKVLLVPVPLHPDRLWERGYNQAEEIARYLSSRLEVPLETRALKRVKATQAQFGLSRAKRMENMTDAFVGVSKFVSGRRVVLIDDIYTSGATLVEASQASLAAGAISVSAITIARAVFKDNSQVCSKRRKTPELREL